jgi:phosphoglycolate phosphatase
MNYQHIIWDWNGTLFDDVWLCVEVLNGVLEKWGKSQTDIESYKQRFGFPVKNYYESLGFDFSVEPFDEIANQFIEEYNRRRPEGSLHEGAVEILEHIKSRDIKQSILSAYHQELLEDVVNYFGIRDYFEKLVGLNDYYANSKVHLGRGLIKDLNLEPQQILLIGDTIHDFEVANDIGVNCVLLSCGHQNRQRLAVCGCEVLDSVRQLSELLQPS